jgi:hypothetical protein
MQSPKYHIGTKGVYQLAAVGLFTGFVTTGFAIQFSAMACLGMALATYLFIFAGFRPVWRLLVFALTTMAIGFIGQVAAAFITLGDWNQWTDPLLLLRTAVISGGGEISGILLAAWALLIPRDRSLRPASIWAFLGLMIAGIFLSAIGWQLGSTLGMWMWDGLAPLRPEIPVSTRHLPNFGPYSFGLLTQTGCAALVGFALWQNRVDVPGSADDEGSTLLFWPAYVLLIPFIVAIAEGAKTESDFTGRLTENAPSTVLGWITKPRSFGQVFVMVPGEDFQPTYGFSFASDHRTQTVAYSLRHRSVDGSKSRNNANFTVTVTQYPNAGWASYDLRQLPTPACLQLYPGLIHKKVISGKAILTCSFVDEPNFYWASNDATILITFNGSEVSEEVLETYLDRYPASELPSVYGISS